MGAVMTCTKCGRELHDHMETIWQHASGWVKRRDAGGTNHLALRELHPDQLMCNGCMQLMLDGIDPGQQSLI